jgi:3-oxoacyl-[acyl-carrier protein] reductase
VNNAGIFPRAAFPAGRGQWDAVLDQPLRTFSAPVRRRAVCGGAGPAIINQAGRAYRGGLRATAYMASKRIVGLTRGMARELAPHRIRVNAVAPGVTNTAMPRLGNTEEELAVLARTNPTGRLAEPEDIADVIVFLATDDARHLIGQVVHVNGGDYHG